MKIYIAHSKEIDYINDLYKPLRNDSFFNDYELILPHEKMMIHQMIGNFIRILIFLLLNVVKLLQVLE